MDAHTILSPEKRYFSNQQKSTHNMIGKNGQDCTDNINSNGCSKYFTHSISTTTTSATTATITTTSAALVRDVNQDLENKSTSKSFIQQRVERLYGPVAVAQGLYSPRKPKTFDENTHSTGTTIMTTTTTITNKKQPTSSSSSTSSTVLIEKSQNATNTTFQSTKYILEAQRNSQMNGLSSTNQNVQNDESIELDSLNEALPVLRHLRPEFRAQLPTLSPKRTIAISKLSTIALSATTTTVTHNNYSNGTSNGTSTNDEKRINATNIDVLNDDTYYNQMPIYDQQQQQQQQKLNNDCNNIGETQTTTLPIADASLNGQNENSCLTSNSNKSHDIEINYRHNNSENDIVLPVNNQSNNLVKNIEMNSKPIIDQIESKDSTDYKNVAMVEHQFDTFNSDDLKSNIELPTKSSIDANGNHKTEQKRDAVYFLNTVHAERDRLLKLAIETEAELDQLIERSDIDEEVLGHLRSASGKARLLATKKFKQFEGLCIDSLNQVTRDMPPPTPEDLQGFWDMVYLQVDNVHALFTELDKLRANGWKKIEQAKPKPPQGAKLIKRPVQSTNASSGTTKKSASAVAAAEKREAQRKQLLEMKRKKKLAMTENAQTNDLVLDDTLSDKQIVETFSSKKNGNENETDR